MRRKWTKPTLVMLALVAGLSLLAVALHPWASAASRGGEIEAEIGKRTGLDVHIGGPVTVKLLPRPRVQISNLSIATPDGTILASAPTAGADLDIPAVLSGRLRLVSVTLTDPTVTVNLDAGPMPAGVFDTSRAPERPALPFRLSIRSGVIRVASGRLGLDTILTDVNATAYHGGGPQSGFALSGSALWRGVVGQFTFLFARPDLMVAGGSSPLHAQITSPLGTFVASGDLNGGDQAQFAGHLSASTSELPRLLGVFASRPTWLDARRASLNGEALVKHGDLALSDCAIRLDDTAFEGTLGIHGGDSGRTLLEGTLATDLLDLDKLAGRAFETPALAAFYRAPFGGILPGANLDLRISASTALVGHAVVEDAAFSILLRDGRLEVTVDEARAYQGVAKGRLVATLRPAGIDAHGELALTGVDVGALSTAWTGRESITGTMSGKLEAEGRGDSPEELVHSLTGQGQATLDHGKFVGLSVSQALRRLTHKLPPTADDAGQVTAFSSASAGIGIVDGVLHLLDGKVTGPGIAMEFGGRTDLPRGSVDITALAMQTDAAGATVVDGPVVPFEMRGTLGAPLLILLRGHKLNIPALPVPSFDATPSLP